MQMQMQMFYFVSLIVFLIFFFICFFSLCCIRKKVSYRYDYTAEVDSFRARGVLQDESLDGKASSSSQALTSIISTDNIHAKDIDRPGSSVNDNLLDATERKGLTVCLL